MVLLQNMSAGPTSSLLQVAVKNNQQPVWYFTDKIVLHALFSEDGRMERGTFLEVNRLYNMMKSAFDPLDADYCNIKHCFRLDMEVVTGFERGPEGIPRDNHRERRVHA